ncbi:MAG: nicotinate phosphoribosyltransferase, partial [Candidatus Thermoplasmatota archaeon]|nr:nicotinate phosphoribosyltransferase [Candidatus Thermoplasmatota archaeon]
AEFTADTFPHNYQWAVFCGLEELLTLFEHRAVDVYAVDEGTIFVNKDRKRIRVPVAYVEGPYGSFCELETPALGLICQASGIATKSARIRKLAGSKTVLSFGIRRMHPAIAPMIDRSAYIGGCDSVSSIAGANAIGKVPVGTMPHALMIMFGDQSAAWKAFDETADESVARIALIDTYYDEKAEALLACKALGKKLTGVRLDTPSSRKGKMEDIVAEVKWEMNIRGFEAKVIVSGGVDEEEVLKLRDLVDGFGVGTCISNAPTINFAMDLVEKEGKPVAKRGKLGGKKQWFRCDHCFNFEVLPWGAEPPQCCGERMKPMLNKVIEKGKRIYASKSAEDIRNYVSSQIACVEEIQ